MLAELFRSRSARQGQHSVTGLRGSGTRTPEQIRSPRRDKKRGDRVEGLYRRRVDHR